MRGREVWEVGLRGGRGVLSGPQKRLLRGRRRSRAGTCGFDRLTCEAEGPVKAPAHNDGRRAAATRTTWQIKKKNT